VILTREPVPRFSCNLCNHQAESRYRQLF